MSESGSDPDDVGSDLQPLRRGRDWELPFAYAYIVGLLVLLVGGFAASIWLGVLDLTTDLSFQAELGWVVEYLAAGLLAVFLIFTFVQVVRITGIGFISGLMGTIARIADNYELEGNAEIQGPGSGESGSEPQGGTGETGDQES